MVRKRPLALRYRRVERRDAGEGPGTRDAIKPPLADRCVETKAFQDQLLDQFVRLAPILDRRREGRPPGRRAEQRDQTGNIAGMVPALQEPALCCLDVRRRLGQRQSCDVVADRHFDVRQESFVVRGIFGVCVAIEIQHCHLLGVRVTAFPGGVGAGGIDQHDRRPACRKRDDDEHEEDSHDEREASALRPSCIRRLV